MTKLVASLEEAWEGGSSLVAIDSLNDLRKHIDELGEGTNDGANKLEGFAALFEALDDGELTPFAFARRLDVTRFMAHIIRPLIPFKFTENLRIIPEQVYTVATECNEISEVMSAKVAELRESLNTLESEWDGKSFVKFSEETTELAEAFTKMAEALEDFSDRIRTVASRYEEIDRMF